MKIAYTIIIEGEVLGDIVDYTKDNIIKRINSMAEEIKSYKRKRIIRLTGDYDVFIDELARKNHIINRRWRVSGDFYTPVTTAKPLPNNININFKHGR